MIEDFLRDVRHAARIVRGNPGYATAATLCLGLAIGVNATVFSLLDEMYFRMLPVPQPDRLISFDRNGGLPVSWRDYIGFRGSLRTFQGMAASQARGTFMDVDRANFEIVAEIVSVNYADVLEIDPAIGRWFLPGDAAPGADPPVVISGRIWTTRFRRNPEVIGRVVRIESQWYRVVGVARDDFRGTSPPGEADAWVPLVSFPIIQPQLRDPLGPGPHVALTGRLAPHETVERAAAEMAVIDARLGRSHPHDQSYATPMAARAFRGIVSPASRSSLRPIAMLLFAIVTVVLLIACVNVANLLLSRAAARQREMALRRSLGASRRRLLRQMLAESTLLALGGAALGIVIGFGTDRALSAWAPASVPVSILRGVHLEMSWRVAACTAGIALFCAVFFSLTPALGGSSLDLLSALKGGALSSRGRFRQRDLFVVAQVSLSLILLIAATLLLRALERASQIDPGFATSRRIYVRLFTPKPDFTPDSSTRLFTRMLENARALPGVRDATLSFDVLGFMDTECVATDGGAPSTSVGINVVEPNYFGMMHVPLLRGRNFTSHDLPDSERVIVVNRTMARRWWPGRNAVDRIVWLGCGNRVSRVPARVIAVASDSKYGALDEEARPFLYVSRHQVWWDGFFALIVETTGDPQAAMEPLLKLVRSQGPNLRIYELRTLDDLVTLSLWRVRWQAGLLVALGILALVLAVIGLYGVVAYAVAQRTREIGIRMALGAHSGDVQWMVLAHGLRLTAAGILAGLAVSTAATRLLRSFLYGVSPLDPVAFAGAALAWFLIAAIAGCIPAQRAARIDPAVSLQYE